MSAPAQNLRAALPLMLVLTLVWGTNWPLFAYAVREISVWTFRAVSVVGAGAILLSWAAVRGHSIRIERRHWPVLIAAAVTYLVVWNIASTYAAVMIPSGQAAILGFTMPLWVALASWLLFGQRPDFRVSAAIALAASGVGLLIWRGTSTFAAAPGGFVFGLLAAMGWAAGTLILKRRPIPVHALVLTGWQLIIAGIPIALVALWLGKAQWFAPKLSTVLVVAYITFVPMAIGNAVWFAIVGLLPANVAGLMAVMVPVVAMLSGALIHGEPLGLLHWLAMALCSSGVVLLLWQLRSE